MTYQIEAIPMTLSHLQRHSYYRPFKCAIITMPSVCLWQDGVLLRWLDVGFQKKHRKI